MTSIRVGQFTGWHGDRADGMEELLRSGVDVLTGDYLSELTMLVLRKNQLRGGKGYVSAFATVLTQHFEEIAFQGVKVISNAGGLEPQACAEEIQRLAAAAGTTLRVAYIAGDDIRSDLYDGQSVREFVNYEDGTTISLKEDAVLSANAYLGAWPIVEALKAGADIIVCPRATDASLLVAAAAWKFDWAHNDFDQLAGALAAGHIIECGAQATGGNFSLFVEHGDLGLPGMPIAEIDSTGACVIEKSVGSGGLVTVDTVTAQLLYEVNGIAYQNPDVVLDISSLQIEQIADDRVRVGGARGFAPTPTTKLSLTFEGGFRNTLTVGLTGLHQKEKLTWLKDQVHRSVGAPDTFDQFRWSVIGPANPHGSYDESTAFVVITARDADRSRVDREGFSDPIVQLATSNIPGFYMTSPPQREKLFAVQWPTLVEKSQVNCTVTVLGEAPIAVAWPDLMRPLPRDGYDVAELHRSPRKPIAVPAGSFRLAALGEIAGTRSGDKADIANVGVWARNDIDFEWLKNLLTVEKFHELVPEADGLIVERHTLSNLRGMNFVVRGFLESGVSSCTRIDAQGKGFGEYLATRIIEVPVTG